MNKIVENLLARVGLMPVGTASATSSASSDARRIATNAAAASAIARSLAGGRVSVDTQQDGFAGAFGLFTRFADDVYWRGHKLDPKALEHLPVTKLIEILAETSPDVSRAIWDFNLFSNPGWKAEAFKPGTESPDEKGQAALNAFFSNLHGPYTEHNVVPADVVFGAMNMSVALRGGVPAELVLDEAGQMPLELATPDPVTLEFRKVYDPVRGRVWQIGQMQNAQFVPFKRETIWYVPLHPLPGKPKGRPMFSPAVFTTLFLVGLMNDLRRVIAQQGYPRLDIVIDFERLRNTMPDGAATDLTIFNNWVNEVVTEIKNQYSKLKPDDAFIHGNIVDVKGAVGTVDAKSLGAIDKIIEALERLAVRALKTQPLLFGTSGGTSEANANRQWEVHVAGIKAIQHMIEYVLERAANIVLQVQGIQAVCRFRFAELRAAEMLRDAQVRRLDNINAAFEYDRGWISQDEAAMRINGRKADVDEPRNGGSSGGANVPVGNVQADPGSER